MDWTQEIAWHKSRKWVRITLATEAFSNFVQKPQHWEKQQQCNAGAADTACRGTRGQQLMAECHCSHPQGPSCSWDKDKSNTFPPLTSFWKKKTTVWKEPMLQMTLIGKLMRTCSKSQCQSVTAGDGISWAPGSAPRSSLPKSSSGQQPRSPTHHHSFCCTHMFCFSCNIQERIPYTKIRINIIFWGKKISLYLRR